MIPTRFYLDSRITGPGTPAILKFVITKNKVRALIPLNIRILPECWDAKRQIALGKAKHLNPLISQTKTHYDSVLIKLEMEGILKSKSAAEIKRLLENEIYGSDDEPVSSSYGPFLSRFLDFKDRHKGRTKGIYEHTLGRIRAFIGDKALENLTFEEITPRWLRGFDDFLSENSNSVNGRNIHMRNIRAVFNDALDDEVITYYPFRKFKIRNEPTRKRSMKVEDLRTLFSMNVEKHEELYRDMFMLIFFLIGINTVDLYNLKGLSKDGRVEYKRAKTGKLYSIKVEPEALSLIRRWEGKSGLLKITDRWIDHTAFRKYLNKALRLIGAKRSGRGGKKGEGLFPEISSYWARHSWATVAASLDIPKETIAAALGHGGHTITDIYIDFDQKKVDEANRKVLDWVLYSKK